MNAVRWLLLGWLSVLAYPALTADPDLSITLHRHHLARLEPTRTAAADTQRARILFELTRLYIDKADRYAGAAGSVDSARYFHPSQRRSTT